MASEEIHLQELLHNKKLVGYRNCWFHCNTTNFDDYFSLYYNGVSTKAHILSAVAFHGFDLENRSKGIEICHRCNIKACFNPDHIYIGTRSENRLDLGKLTKANRDYSICTRGHDLGGKRDCGKCRIINDFKKNPWRTRKSKVTEFLRSEGYL